MTANRITFDLIPAHPLRKPRKQNPQTENGVGDTGKHDPLRSLCRTSWGRISHNAIYDLRKHRTDREVKE